MRLSSLTIKGFKSFRNETVFNFTEDVIGIIGPNGSGKSNVIDAIRWVLGETKSRELRLESMSNLIFNGTSKVKASNQAKVTLTFENTKNLLPTEYNNVSISRLLYKDGTSEYRLNDVKCRRKDILTLFMDTGIGSNSYAIIELAMVDSILQDKDNARRLMFEQAAGISKYKSRKRETLLKLKNTNADLERVEDLLVEIEDNLKRIEKQARRTQRFYELKKVYKTKSTAFAKIEISHLEKEMEASKAKIDEQREIFVKVQTEANTLDAEIEKQKKGNLDSEKLLSEKQKELSTLLEDLRSKETAKSLAKEKLQYLFNDTQRVEAELKSANPRIELIEEDIQKADAEMAELTAQKDQLEQDVRDSEDVLVKLREQYKNEKEELERIVEEQKIRSEKILSFEREKGGLSGQIENVSNQLELLEEQLPSVEEELKRLESEKVVLVEKEATALSTFELQQQTEEKQKQAIVDSQENLEDIKHKLSKVSRVIDAKSNEYKLTKSMVENLEGYPDSIKFLSKNDKWASKATLVSDIITVDSDYRVAIENYLEPYLNYFVVPTHKDATSGIKLLRDSQKGKANFLIANAAKKKASERPKGFQSEPALDHVNFEQGFEVLGAYLLGNVFISEQEDVSPTDVKEGVTVISKEGGVILQSARMSGGSIGLFEGKKIGRKKGMEQLAKDLEKLEKEELELKQKVDLQTQSIGQLKLDIKAVDVNASRDQLTSIQRDLAGLNAKINSQQGNVDELLSRRSKSKGYMMELQEKLMATIGGLTNIRDEVESSTTGGEDMSVHIQKLNEQLQQAAGQSNQANIALIQFNNKVNSITQLLNIKRNQLEELVSKTQEGSATLEKHAEQQVDLKEKIAQLTDDLEDAYVIKAKATSSLNEVETNYFQSRSGIYEQEDRLKKLNQKVASAQSLINGLKDERQRVEFRIQSLLDRLSVEFKITKEDIMAFEIVEEYDREELQHAIAKLGNRLDNYGEINPMALEAFEEIKVRYDDMKQQKEDIIEAQKSLQETILEIEATATTQFLEAFDQVREHFIEIFRTLFQDGDECDLILLDRENPLESTIDIIAKPKGKKPLSISMLSGGEKTLTATALLFSLYLLKPAPFCIFDEVDAPLDDVNVSKFNKIIRRFSNDSQFIIVTHNKLTMECLDTMYGIFQEEMGISTTSLVDFRQFKESGAMETLLAS